jgi:hypothetical protein
MLLYSDVESFLSTGLADLGYTDWNPNVGAQTTTMPLINPGPFLPPLDKLSPQAMVFATVGNGSGLELEQTYDGVFIVARVLGPQNDFPTAERLAMDIDTMLLRLNSPAMLGTTRVLSVQRTGGRPQLVDYDDSNRYHFQTTYIARAKSGL